MGLDVSALSTYTDQISSGLMKETILNADTVGGNLVTLKFGVIGDTTQINVVKSTMYGVAGGCGDFADTGSTVMAVSNINMCAIEFPNQICIKTLKSYWYDFYMEQSYNTESLGQFEDVFMANKADAVSLEVDKILWQGSNSSPSYAAVTGNKTLCDGFLQVAYEASASTAANIAKTAITASNAYAIIDDILGDVASNAPVLIDGAEVYMSPADFQNYLTSLRGLNLFNYDTKAEAVTRILHPGSIGLFINRVNGLQGVASGTFLITTKENIVAAFSDESDLQFRTWYSKDADALRMKAELKLGVGFGQPELVVRVA